MIKGVPPLLLDTSWVARALDSWSSAWRRETKGRDRGVTIERLTERTFVDDPAARRLDQMRHYFGEKVRRHVQYACQRAHACTTYAHVHMHLHARMCTCMPMLTLAPRMRTCTTQTRTESPRARTSCARTWPSGAQVALYFAFLESFTNALLPLALIAIIVTIAGRTIFHKADNPFNIFFSVRRSRTEHMHPSICICHR